jgi:hypothetical protein
MQATRIIVGIATPLLSAMATFAGLSFYGQRQSPDLASAPPPQAQAPLPHWPSQCTALRHELQERSQQTEIRYQARPIEPFVTPAWKLSWHGDLVALPFVDYSDVQVLRNQDGQLMVVLQDQRSGTRVLLNRLRQEPPLEDVFATVPHPSLMLAALQGGDASLSVPAQSSTPASAQSPAPGTITAIAPELPGPQFAVQTAAVPSALSPALPQPVSPWTGVELTQHLFGEAIALEQLVDLGYRHRPSALSCRAQRWEQELPIALGLSLKLMAGPGGEPQAAYAGVGQKPGRLVRYQAGERQLWQGRIEDGAFYSEIAIALPSDHESAEVGLGLGLEGWWETEPRPPWMVALERALASDRPYSWQVLIVELHRAGLSQASVASIQRLIAIQEDADDALADDSL